MMSILKNTHTKSFIAVIALVSIWINFSEVIRYFIWVMPATKSYFPHDDRVADMDLGIFLIWGLWDTLLTTVLVIITYLTIKVLGNSILNVVRSALLVWATIFVIFWVASANMGLSDWNILWVTLPLSLIEMMVGAYFTSILLVKFQHIKP